MMPMTTSVTSLRMISTPMAWRFDSESSWVYVVTRPPTAGSVLVPGRTR